MNILIQVLVESNTIIYENILIQVLVENIYTYAT